MENKKATSWYSGEKKIVPLQIPNDDRLFLEDKEKYKTINKDQEFHIKDTRQAQRESNPY